MAYPETKLPKWLSSTIGFKELAELMGKAPGEPTVAYGPRKMVEHLEQGIGGKGDQFRDPSQYVGAESWMPPGTREVFPGQEVRAGGPPRPEAGGATPTPDTTVPSPSRPEQPGDMAWPKARKPKIDPTTGVYRIDTPREEIIEVLRAPGASGRRHFNPQTGANYGSILEAMWGGVPKPPSEKMKAAGNLAVARETEGGADMIAQLRKMAQDMGMIPPDTEGGGKGVARPARPTAVDEMVPMEGASIPGSGEVGIPSMTEHFTPDDRGAYPIYNPMAEQRKKKLLEEEFAF